MKTKLLVLLVLLIALVSYTQAQSKKDIEADLAKCTTTNDSIQNLLTGLSANYDTMYNAVKEKVLLYDFDPVNMSVLIDSLRTGRDEAFSNTLNDSLAVLMEENTKLKELLESMGDESDKDTEIVNDLTQLKELLDNQIITQEEFDAKKAVLLEKL